MLLLLAVKAPRCWYMRVAFCNHIRCHLTWHRSMVFCRLVGFLFFWGSALLRQLPLQLLALCKAAYTPAWLLLIVAKQRCVSASAWQLHPCAQQLLQDAVGRVMGYLLSVCN